MPSKLHNFYFKRRRNDPDLWFGHCSCGWNAIGPEERVKFLAAGHDLDWQTPPCIPQRTLQYLQSRSEFVCRDCGAPVGECWWNDEPIGQFEAGAIMRDSR